MARTRPSPGIYRHGNRWYYRYTPAPGHKQKPTPGFLLLADTERFRAACIAARKAGQRAPDPATFVSPLWDPPLWDYLNDVWLPEHERVAGNDERTDEAWRRVARIHIRCAPFAMTPLSQIDPHEITRWQDARVDRIGYKPLSQAQRTALAAAGEPNPEDKWPALAPILANSTTPWASDNTLGIVEWQLRSTFEHATANPAVMLGAFAYPPRKAIARKTRKRLERQAQHRAATKTIELHHLLPIYEGLGEADRLTMLICLFLGPRIEEAFGLRIGDINFDTGKSWIRNQAGAWVDDLGTRHPVRMYTKSVERYVFAPQGVLAEVERALTARFGARVNWPPLAPILVDQSGAADHEGAARNFRSRLKALLNVLQLPVDWSDAFDSSEPLTLAATPHGFRSAIASRLSADATIDGKAITTFLGHKASGVWSSASRTAQKYYIREVETAMRRIADAGDKIIAEIGLPLGQDITITAVPVAEAAQQLHVRENWLYTQIRDGLITPVRITARPIGEVRARRISAMHISAEDMARLKSSLRPDPHVALCAAQAAQRMRLDRTRVVEISRNPTELRRWVQGNGDSYKPDIYIDTASMTEWMRVQQLIDDGLALRSHDACARAGVGHDRLADLTDNADGQWIHNGQRWWSTDLLDSIAAADPGPGLMRLGEAARTARVSKLRFIEQVGNRGPDLSTMDGRLALDADLARRVIGELISEHRTRTERLRTSSVANAPHKLATDPDPAIWAPISTLQDELDIAHAAAAINLVKITGTTWGLYRNGAYVSCNGLDKLMKRLVPDGWVTVARAAALTGQSRQWVLSQIKQRRFRARARQEGLSGALVCEQDVQAHVDDCADTSHVSLSDARALLGCDYNQFDNLIHSSDAPFTIIGSIATRTGKARARALRAEVLAFKNAETPPEGYLTVTQFRTALSAAGVHLPESEIYRRLKYPGRIPGAKKYRLGGWRIPPAAVGPTAHPDWEHFLAVPQVLDRLGMYHRQSSTIVGVINRAIHRGQVPGAVLTHEHGHWRIPPTSIDAVAHAVADAGYPPPPSDTRPDRTMPDGSKDPRT